MFNQLKPSHVYQNQNTLPPILDFHKLNRVS